MKEFKTIIGGNIEDVKNTRVDNKSRDVKDTSEILIQKMKMEFRALQNTIEETLDLGPNTTDDLANLKNVNPDTLLNTIYTTADKMAALAKRIKIRCKIHNTLFPDSKIEDLKKEDLDFLAGLV